MNIDELGWSETSRVVPREGEVVHTMIMDGQGSRNHQKLKRIGNLWFIPDGSIYVYYKPTHWKPL